jgi:hypothetical protein
MHVSNVVFGFLMADADFLRKKCIVNWLMIDIDLRWKNYNSLVTTNPEEQVIV